MGKDRAAKNTNQVDESKSEVRYAAGRLEKGALGGYKKELVLQYISELEGTFSQKLLEKDAQMDRAVHQAQERARGLEEENRALREELDQFKGRQDPDRQGHRGRPGQRGTPCGRRARSRRRRNGRRPGPGRRLPVRTHPADAGGGAGGAGALPRGGCRAAGGHPRRPGGDRAAGRGAGAAGAGAG